jgi:hypothetical protein
MPQEREEDRIAIFIDLGSMFQDGSVLHFRLRCLRLEDITSRVPRVGTPDADPFSEAIAASNRPDCRTASQECAEPGRVRRNAAGIGVAPPRGRLRGSEVTMPPTLD